MRIAPTDLGLIAACVGLTALAAVPWLTEPAARPPPGATATPAGAAPLPWWVGPLPALESFGETGRRPLFEATRRPPPTGPGLPLAEVDPGLALGRYRIDGVVVSRTERIAMIKDVGRNAVLTVREGDRLEGWTIERVGLGGVSLRLGAEELSLPVGPRKE